MLHFCEKALAFIKRYRNQKDGFHPQGIFTVECRDKDGNLKWMQKAPNGVTDAGINMLLNIGFNQTAPGSYPKLAPNWYVGLITDPAVLAAGDTMASHAGWTEWTNYTEATRVLWTAGVAAAKQITNAGAMVFTMNTGGTVYGFFVTSVNTKGGATGTLWSTAQFTSGSQVVVSSDVLNVTYTLSAA